MALIQTLLLGLILNSMCMVTNVPRAKEENQKKKKFFIAIADRGVKGTVGLFNHYSVQYWQCDEDVPLGDEISVADLSSKCPSSTKIKSVGFLRSSGWEVWTSKNKMSFDLFILIY